MSKYLYMQEEGTPGSIGDEVECWLNARKAEQQPQKPTEEQTKNLLGQVMDFMDRSEQSRFEVAERQRRLYTENPTYKEITDLYHDLFGAISNIPEFREAVQEAYKKVVRDEMNNPYRDRTKPPAPLYEMLDSVFHNGVFAQFKRGSYIYHVHVRSDLASCTDDLDIYRGKSENLPDNISREYDQREYIWGKKPGYDEGLRIHIDKGKDSTPDLMAGRTRDYLHTNQSSITEINYHSPVGEKGVSGDEYDISQLSPVSLENARTILGDLITPKEQNGITQRKWVDSLLRTPALGEQTSLARPAEFSTPEASEQYTSHLINEYLQNLRKIPHFAEQEIALQTELEESVRGKTGQSERIEATFKIDGRPIKISIGNTSIIVSHTTQDGSWYRYSSLEDDFYKQNKLVVLIGTSEQIDKLKYFQTFSNGERFYYDLSRVKLIDGVSRIDLQTTKPYNSQFGKGEIHAAQAKEGKVISAAVGYSDRSEYNGYIASNFQQIQEQSSEMLKELQKLISPTQESAQ